MQQYEPLTYENYYHIYNRGINSCNLFPEEENYRYFMKLYNKYISPVADTLAWALMPNHFHFLIRIKEPVQNLSGLKPPHQYFSNLFNAYTKAFNKRYQRHGALFERPFRRKLIDNDNFLRNVLIYIHSNPIHHGFCNFPEEYPWSSYHDYFLDEPVNIFPEVIIELFDDLDNFKYMHERKAKTFEMED